MLSVEVIEMQLLLYVGVDNVLGVRLTGSVDAALGGV